MSRKKNFSDERRLKCKKRNYKSENNVDGLARMLLLSSLLEWQHCCKGATSDPIFEEEENRRRKKKQRKTDLTNALVLYLL